MKVFKALKSLLSKDEEEEILAFIYENRNRLREMSLRTALKVGDLKKISEKWQSLAVSTCMKRPGASMPWTLCPLLPLLTMDTSPKVCMSPLHTGQHQDTRSETMHTGPLCTPVKH